MNTINKLSIIEIAITLLQTFVNVNEFSVFRRFFQAFFA